MVWISGGVEPAAQFVIWEEENAAGIRHAGSHEDELELGEPGLEPREAGPISDMCPEGSTTWDR